MLTIDRVSTGRTLVSEKLFARLTARIVRDHPELAADLPARILDQALAFLVACAVNDESLGPSGLVDIGWHTFILHTREYAEFCQVVAGRFIHHQPEPDPEGSRRSGPEPIGAPISRTVAAIVAAGFAVDHELWGGTSAECSQCHAGCHDSPTR